MVHFSKLFILFCVLCAFFPTRGEAAGTKFGIYMGTGGLNGIYYPTGKAMCKAVNNNIQISFKCAVKSTHGSIENIEKLRNKETNFGIVQSDVLYYAVHGYGPFKNKGRFPQLRTVMSLYTESFTILARKDSGIRNFNDLKGKRVNIGSPRSGGRTSMDLVMRFKGWDKSVFSKALELTPAEISGALCDNKVDAIVSVIGHPNAALKKEAAACETVLVNAYDPQIKAMIHKFPYLNPIRIRNGLYKGSPDSTMTFGVESVLVTTESTPRPTVIGLIRSVVDGYSDFIYSHNALQAVTKEMLAATDEITPLHLGASQVFKK
ncbi:MAG: TAXI family TRAP transporter solute-binding subunit [Magnetovibrio sp.]|nr:TAXI family TRAP transporter solute-binding subunit [Magnetovibrio sp.]